MKAIRWAAVFMLGCGAAAEDPALEEPCQTEPGAEYTAWHDPAQALVYVQRKRGYLVQVATINDTDSAAHFGDVSVQVRPDLTVCALP